MKKISILILSLIIFSTLWKVVFSASSCKYKSEIDQCKSVNNENWGARGIKEFMCIDWSREEVAYQVVMDKLETKLDEKIEEFLDNLEQSKDYYFWPKKKENYLSWVDYIEKNLWTLWYFEWEYQKLCNTKVYEETLPCLAQNPKKASWQVKNANNFLWNWDCESHYKTKLAIYRQVAYETLKDNKKKIDKDLHKEFTQKQRKKYDELLDALMINLAYLERIWKGWTSKTKNVYK